MQELKDGLTPFLSKHEATRERFARWNMQTTAMKSGEHTHRGPTYHLKSGVETRTLTLSYPPIRRCQLLPHKWFCS